MKYVEHSSMLARRVEVHEQPRPHNAGDTTEKPRKETRDNALGVLARMPQRDSPDLEGETPDQSPENYCASSYVVCKGREEETPKCDPGKRRRGLLEGFSPKDSRRTGGHVQYKIAGLDLLHQVPPAEPHSIDRQVGQTPQRKRQG